MSTDSAPFATGANFDKENIINKENLITHMPKLFGQNSSESLTLHPTLACRVPLNAGMGTSPRPLTESLCHD